ncbi:S8 family peptidase [Nocardia farcinica]|uniref:S8 family peptidase n=1 Tax=Nocardia farcinica TaxID=37329 RepID=UPI0024578581|nr:S8 family serine peptidase [Nocardia farcinica]
MSESTHVLAGETLVVLRAPARAVLREPNAGPAAFPAEVAADVRINIDEVDAATLRSVAADPTVVGFGPAMPMRLVEPAERGGVVAAAAGPTWGVEAVGATTSPFTGQGVTVAVLDTGIDADHPAFAGVDLVTRDFTGGGSAHDKDGHGTHCAGTIFGRDLDGTRIGVARGVGRALIGKVLGPGGGGSDTIAEAILWARDNGAHVISMSLGIDFPGFVEKLVTLRGLSIPVATSLALRAYTANVQLFETLSQFLAAGIGQPMVVAATGNESGRDRTPPFEIDVAPPAAAAGIVAVGALGRTANGLAVAPFSNSRATVSAPGVGVVSAAVGGGTESMSGTSMATPHAAGVAALWAEKLAAQGQLAPLVLQAKLIGEATTDRLIPGTDPTDTGAGLVRAPQS